MPQWYDPCGSSQYEPINLYQSRPWDILTGYDYNPFTEPIHETSIESLPVELLTKILMFAARSLSSPSSASFPVMMSHVNRRWYRVVTEYPSLWADLVILPRHPPVWTDVRIRRSRNKLIDITFDYRNLMSYDIERQARLPTMRVVAPHSHRWRTFTMISMETSIDSNTLLEILTDLPAPNLKSLRLLFGKRSSDAAAARIVLYISPAFSSVMKNLTTLELSSPFEEYRGPTVKELRELARVAKRLQNLTVYGLVVTDDDSDYPIKMPSLLSLSVGFARSKVELNNLLQMLYAENLDSLELNSLSNEHWCRLSGLLTPKLFPNLRKLTMIDVDINIDGSYRYNPEHHVWLMRALPMLNEVLMSGNINAMMILDVLNGKHGSSNNVPYWPQLQTIGLPSNVSYNAVIDLVKSRASLRVALKKVCLDSHFLHSLAESDLARLAGKVGVKEIQTSLLAKTWTSKGVWQPRSDVVHTAIKTFHPPRARVQVSTRPREREQSPMPRQMTPARQLQAQAQPRQREQSPMSHRPQAHGPLRQREQSPMAMQMGPSRHPQPGVPRQREQSPMAMQMPPSRYPQAQPQPQARHERHIMQNRNAASAFGTRLANRH